MLKLTQCLYNIFLREYSFWAVIVPTMFLLASCGGDGELRFLTKSFNDTSSDSIVGQLLGRTDHDFGRLRDWQNKSAGTRKQVTPIYSTENFPTGYFNHQDITFQKLNNMGEVLDDEADSWECVKDVSNNLIWENKTAEQLLEVYHFKELALENIDPTTDSDPSGSTREYLDDINLNTKCGVSEWRLPTDKELLTIRINDSDLNQSFQISNLDSEGYSSDYENLVIEALNGDASNDFGLASLEAANWEELKITFLVNKNFFSGFTDQSMLKSREKFLSTVLLARNEPAIILKVPFSVYIGNRTDDTIYSSLETIEVVSDSKIDGLLIAVSNGN